MLKRILKVIGIVVVLFIFAVGLFWYFYLKPKPLPISPEDRAQLTLMPLPAKAKLKSGNFEINIDFGIETEGPADSLLARAITRFKNHLNQKTSIQFSGRNKAFVIKYDSASSRTQQVKENESYTLKINANSIELNAVSTYGVLRGLETLLQLVKKENDKWLVPQIKVEDEPRYSWRGLMIDVGRHWIPKDGILRALEAMSVVKLNVFHWHLSDYQGFRVESKIFPKLQDLGSNGQFYTQDDVREIVQFASDRGIRVVPEFDVPGHTTSFLVGYPALASAPGPYKLDTAFGVLTPVMNPASEDVYKFLDRFVEEMTGLFPDPYFHIGGDEVAAADWNKNASILAFMKKNNFKDDRDLQAYFNHRMEAILKKHGKKMVGWDEILHPDLGPEIVVQCWRNQKSLFTAVQEGRQAILSAPYYLDRKLPAAQHYAVDPEVLPGAVTIEPDSVHWKLYDLKLIASGNEIKTSLVLYGENNDLRGIFGLQDGLISFDKATIKEKSLVFSFDSDYGKIEFNGIFKGDSLSGKMGLGLLSFPFKGKMIGSNELAGTKPPKVEKVKPLTTEESKRILGGEATMWTEIISQQNLDSRLWPRTAAIAEKLWSPKVLTGDNEDMYRRLDSVSIYLAKRGSKHFEDQKELVHDLAEGKDQAPVLILVDALEEVKYYERLLLNPTTETKLNEVVDAAAAESNTARHFNKMVDELIADPGHQQHIEEIKKQLMIWRDNHAAFVDVAKGNPRLTKVLPMSLGLSELSKSALESIDALQHHTSLKSSDRTTSQAEIEQVSISVAGVMLPELSGLRKLVLAPAVKD